MRWWTFGFHKMRGISWLAENRLASQEVLCFMDWVSVGTQLPPQQMFIGSYYFKSRGHMFRPELWWSSRQYSTVQNSGDLLHASTVQYTILVIFTPVQYSAKFWWSSSCQYSTVHNSGDLHASTVQYTILVIFFMPVQYSTQFWWSSSQYSTQNKSCNCGFILLSDRHVIVPYKTRQTLCGISNCCTVQSSDEVFETASS
jgi:hypothetical protein